MRHLRRSRQKRFRGSGTATSFGNPVSVRATPADREVSHVGIGQQHLADHQVRFNLELAWAAEPPGLWHATVQEGPEIFEFSSPLAFLEWLEHRTLAEADRHVDLP